MLGNCVVDYFVLGTERVPMLISNGKDIFPAQINELTFCCRLADDFHFNLTSLACSSYSRPTLFSPNSFP